MLSTGLQGVRCYDAAAEPDALIPLILIIVPIIEITLFIQIGGAIGWTLLVILATAMLGARAIRRQD